MLSSLFSMKKRLSKTEAKEKIDSFFKQKTFSPKDVGKIKRLAMKHNIKLGKERQKFCKSCLNPLKRKIRITKDYKIVECSICGEKNRIKIS